MIAFLSLLPGRAWMTVAALVAIVAAYWVVTDAAYRQGKADGLAAMHRANEQARSKADDASQKVEDCIGRWDRNRGRCVFE